ncbi:LOW QUALITY PROTEIN: translocating chain-associated membrane protein 1-like 1 [Haliotis rubra]|uniref:LOW QUALITY PROTEIN: translocating chain-associated membrane protein 1-like 1 n=1 Tax=Haliotis rubra TaxID=36100 RepID=UPI001EE5DD47|nr:LOW QUALITY PROTEIN: translocating chain-associated membrane protein 1-like 1 [Haliotis rubra]
MAPRRSKSTKNPPILSHEFFIQNHADIVSCVAMVFVIGLMFQATSPVASLFVAMQHNVTQNDTEDSDFSLYTYGTKDMFAVFFYFLICIVIHAVIQEYILDKMNRKMHLSKVKHSLFNESGQLLSFYLVSAVWGADIILRESYVTNINQLWEEYPHSQLPFIVKFYFIIQISYWLHCYPELYFQKTKRDEMGSRIQYATMYLLFITVAYVLNFSRVALCMLVLHYAVEFVFHVARLLYFAEKTEFANTGFMIFNVLFVLVRLGSITLAVLTFWYGLEQSSQDTLDPANGNFNTKIIRINCLAAVCILQAWMMWNFITFHLRISLIVMRKSAAAKKTRSPSKKKVKALDEDFSALPEVDQNNATENGSVRNRSKSKKGQ